MDDDARRTEKFPRSLELILAEISAAYAR